MMTIKNKECPSYFVTKRKQGIKKVILIFLFYFLIFNRNIRIAFIHIKFLLFLFNQIRKTIFLVLFLIVCQTL